MLNVLLGKGDLGLLAKHNCGPGPFFLNRPYIATYMSSNLGKTLKPQKLKEIQRKTVETLKKGKQY